MSNSDINMSACQQSECRLTYSLFVATRNLPNVTILIRVHRCVTVLTVMNFDPRSSVRFNDGWELSILSHNAAAAAAAAVAASYGPQWVRPAGAVASQSSVDNKTPAYQSVGQLHPMYRCIHSFDRIQSLVQFDYNSMRCSVQAVRWMRLWYGQYHCTFLETEYNS